jgi:hypothetical protein
MVVGHGSKKMVNRFCHRKRLVGLVMGNSASTELQIWVVNCRLTKIRIYALLYLRFIIQPFLQHNKTSTGTAP